MVRFDDRNAVPVYNFDDTVTYSRSLLFLFYSNFDRPVDTFLLLGGMLACWTMLNALDKFVVAVDAWKLL